MSNFSVSHSVFKRRVYQGRQKVSLCGNGLTVFTTVFQLYHGSQCTYPYFPGVLLTSTLHNIISKPLAAFPLNCFPSDKISDWSNLKALADDKIKVLNMMIFVFGRVEDIVEKGENGGYQHFDLFPQCFQRA